VQAILAFDEGTGEGGESHMSERKAVSIGNQKQGGTKASMLIEVRIREPHTDCPLYIWDRERQCLRFTGIYQAKPGLPADLASFQLEGQAEWPLLLLNTYSTPPETLVQARLLGALGYGPSANTKGAALPADGWVFVGATEGDRPLSVYQSLETLPPAQLTQLQVYVQAQAEEEQEQDAETVQLCPAETAARLIRETRVLLKREKRMQPKGKGWLKREEEEEKPVAWRAIEGLAEALRAEIQKNAFLEDATPAPHAQAEHLIRFVPQRFQQALADLLLDDERLLAFVERPLLRHRTGWWGMQTWRSNEGLFLVTDRQVLWLRDFLTPGNSFLPGGYIAHVAPLERLETIALLPAGRTPDEFAERLESKDSPYQRLLMEVASSTGSELFAVEFPAKLEVEKALARISDILRAFLPYLHGSTDRRVRRLPAVEAWLPRGAEAKRLAGLGGFLPPALAERLEHRLFSEVQASGEELLVSASVPALEDYRSPARLVALTRRAVLVIEDAKGKFGSRTGAEENQTEQVHRYDLATISSAQLRQSLLGSSLSLFVPQPEGHVQQHVFPFHSPAIAWFLPLFTRLRLLLSTPY